MTMANSSTPSHRRTNFTENIAGACSGDDSAVSEFMSDDLIAAATAPRDEWLQADKPSFEAALFVPPWCAVEVREAATFYRQKKRAEGDEVLALYLTKKPADVEGARLFSLQAAQFGPTEDTYPILRRVAKAGAPANMFLGYWLQACVKGDDYEAARDAVESLAKQLGVAPLAWDWNWADVLARSPDLPRMLHVSVFYFVEQHLWLAGDVATAEEVARICVRTYPSLSGPVLRLAEHLYNRERDNEATALLLEFLAVRPDDYHALRSLATHGLSTGEEEIYRAFEIAAEKGVAPDKLLQLWLPGALRVGNVAAAEQAVRTLAPRLGGAAPGLELDWPLVLNELGPHKLLAANDYYLLSDRLVENDKAESGEGVLRAAVRAMPDQEGPRLRLASLLYSQGRKGAGDEVLEGLLAIWPANAKAMAMYAREASIHGPGPAAFDVMEKELAAGFPAGQLIGPWIAAAVQAKNLPAARRGAAAAARQLGSTIGNDPSATIGQLLAVLDLSRHVHIASYYSLVSLLDEDERRREASEILELAGRAHPTNSGPVLRQAERMVRAGDRKGAARLLATFLERTPTDIAAALMYAREIAPDNYREAVHALELAVKDDAGVDAIAGSWLQLCVSTGDAIGARQAAETCAVKAGLGKLAVGWTWPDFLASSRRIAKLLHLSTYYGLTEMHAAAGDDEGANAILRQAIAVYPAESGPVLVLARRLSQFGEAGAGDIALQEFLAENPRDEAAALELARRLSNRQAFDDAFDVLQGAAAGGQVRAPLAKATIEASIAAGDAESARRWYEQAVADERLAVPDRWVAALLSLCSRDLSAGEDILATALSSLPEDYNWRRDVEDLLEDVRDRRSVARQLDAIKITSRPKGVCLVVDQRPWSKIRWIGPVLTALRRQGYAVATIGAHHDLPTAKSGHGDVDRLQSVLDASLTRLADDPPQLSGHRCDWSIPAGHASFRVEGLDLTQPIKETLRRTFRRYEVNAEHPHARIVIERAIDEADAILALCERVRRTVATPDMPVAFLALQPRSIVTAALKAYCAAHAGSGMTCTVASDLGGDADTRDGMPHAVSVLNMTRHPGVEGPSQAVASRFQAWRAAHQDSFERAASGAKQAASRATDTSVEADVVRKAVLSHRLRGGRVVCLFGRVLHEMNLRGDRGPIHGSVRDWIANTIGIVGGGGGLLLIRPDPEEGRQRGPAQLFTEMLPHALPRNVIVTNADWFSYGDLAPMIDLGVFWDGSGALELQAHGVPALVCGDWAPDDPLLRLRRPGTPNEYRDVLLEPRKIAVSPAEQAEARQLLGFLQSSDVVISLDRNAGKLEDSAIAGIVSRIFQDVSADD